MNRAIDLFSGSVFPSFRPLQTPECPNSPSRGPPAQSIIFIGIDASRAETQVDDADVVLASMRRNPIKSRQNALDRSLSDTV